MKVEKETKYLLNYCTIDIQSIITERKIERIINIMPERFIISFRILYHLNSILLEFYTATNIIYKWIEITFPKDINTIYSCPICFIDTSFLAGAPSHNVCPSKFPSPFPKVFFGIVSSLTFMIMSQAKGSRKINCIKPTSVL